MQGAVRVGTPTWACAVVPLLTGLQMRQGGGQLGPGCLCLWARTNATGAPMCRKPAAQPAWPSEPWFVLHALSLALFGAHVQGSPSAVSRRTTPLARGTAPPRFPPRWAWRWAATSRAGRTT